MSKFVKVLTLLLAAVMLLTAVSCAKSPAKKKAAENRKLDELFEYVFDAGTYTDLDYNYAKKYFEKEYDNYGGGCTAVAKVNKAGDTIIGRNMDLNISNKCAYVMRTAVKDCYKTVGLMYTFRDVSPDYKDVVKNGISDDFSKLLPFMSDDVLNEKGLYIEVNMRYGEFWPTGESKFSCPGTNPESNEKVYMFEIPRYIGEHCATVDEALEYVKTLNVYAKDGYWNYCFIIADAMGHYGLLEFAQNKVYWKDYQQAQANFYINEECAKIQELKCGVGRYNKVMSGIDAVETEDDMFSLIDSVSYFQVYDPDTCKFDYFSENVGALNFATYDYVTAPENKDYITQAIRENGKYVHSLSRQELRDANEYWESAFTEVINCNKKTLKVRFFENSSTVMTLGFDK